MSTFTVQGTWRPVSSSSADLVHDRETTITGTHVPYSFAMPARAAPAPTRTPHPHVVNANVTDAIDDFFGLTHPRASQHDPRLRPSLGVAVPPPYTEADVELPAYSVNPSIDSEPMTLATYLFKFGFLFPPLWIFGAIILVSPLPVPADFEPSKSRRECEELVRIIRTTEVRWARRCAWALGVVFVLASGTAAAILAASYL